MEIIEGENYFLCTCVQLNLTKQQRKDKVLPSNRVMIPVTVVANIPLNGDNQKLWTVIAEDGLYHNVWSNQLKEA